MAKQKYVIPTFEKDPNAELDYGFDWAAGGPNDASDDDGGWLQGETISTSQWIMSSELNLISSTNTATTTGARIGGGVLGKNYMVTNRIVTSTGQTQDRSLKMVIVPT